MTFWKTPVDLKALQKRCKGTLSDILGISFTEINEEGLIGTMQVTPSLMQPMGILHGGASCVFAETIGTAAALFCVDPTKYTCVGLSILVNHVRPVSEGLLTAFAKPNHIGKTTQVWNIEIRNEGKQLTAVSQFTVAVRPLER
jgi:1,4-dihydroxy-2-naphthoyl-CoA hydrolase